MSFVFSKLRDKSVPRSKHTAKIAIICSPISIICLRKSHLFENVRQMMSFVFSKLREKSVSHRKQAPHFGDYLSHDRVNHLIATVRPFHLCLGYSRQLSALSYQFSVLSSQLFRFSKIRPQMFAASVKEHIIDGTELQ